MIDLELAKDVLQNVFKRLRWRAQRRKIRLCGAEIHKRQHGYMRLDASYSYNTCPLIKCYGTISVYIDVVDGRSIIGILFRPTTSMRYTQCSTYHKDWHLDEDKSIEACLEWLIAAMMDDDARAT